MFLGVEKKKITEHKILKDCKKVNVTSWQGTRMYYWEKVLSM